MAPKQVDHQGRVERLLQHLRDEPREEVVMSVFLWRGEKYVGEDSVAAPKFVHEQYPMGFIKDVQAAMLRSLIASRGADAYLFLTEAKVAKVNTKTGEEAPDRTEVLLLSYCAKDGTQIDKVFEIGHHDGKIVLEKEAFVGAAFREGRSVGLFDEEPAPTKKPKVEFHDPLSSNYNIPDGDYSRN